MTQDTNTLAALLQDWHDAKAQENRIRDARVKVEEEIIAITGAKDEGSQTHEAGEYKVTVTGKLTRTIDTEKWRAIEPGIPEALRPVQYRPVLDNKGLRWLQDNEPEIYAEIAPAITTKPAKTGVTVKGK